MGNRQNRKKEYTLKTLQMIVYFTGVSIFFKLPSRAVFLFFAHRPQVMLCFFEPTKFEKLWIILYIHAILIKHTNVCLNLNFGVKQWLRVLFEHG